MGWNTSPARLSRYEQGRILPSRDTLEKLCAILDLAPGERGLLLMEAGHLPSDEEVDKVLQRLQPFLNEWRAPAYLADFAWRFLGWNETAVELFGFPTEELALLPKEKPNLLEFSFDARWAPRRCLPQEIVVPFAQGQIALFKAHQRDRTEQRWYRQLLQRLLSFPLFRELWYATNSHAGSELRDYARIQLDTPLGRLDSHIFACQVMADPRFFAALWVPADDASAGLFA